MRIVIGAFVKTCSEESVSTLYQQLQEIAKEIANNVVPVQLSRNGNRLARLLTSEILRNTLHGSEATIEIERHKNGSFVLTTLNHHGVDRLTNFYSPSVERELAHQGTVLIERIAGECNYHYHDDGEVVFTQTLIDQSWILSVSLENTKTAV